MNSIEYVETLPNMSERSLNNIFKKILFELNSLQTVHNNILLITDSKEDIDNINQKLLFLLKQKNVIISSLLLKKISENNSIRTMSLYMEGYYHILEDLE